MHKTVVINAVGLTPSLLEHMPGLSRLGPPAQIEHVLPAVTSSVQATYLTGTLPREHGIVGNGWYFRDQCEIRFWHQSDKLVQRPRIWETARQRYPSFTCANLFWWNAMYSSADVTVTPRPMYLADGRKIPDVWTNPPELRFILQNRYGRFPLFNFWGPGASIESTDWIAKSAITVDLDFDPTLTLIYLPHLDYNLQRLGPDDPAILQDLRRLDDVMQTLLNHYLNQNGARVIVLSEYGIEPVNRPVHLNRLLRQTDLLAVRDEMGREVMDAGGSAAFAVADHQVAHVYLNDPVKLQQVKELLEAQAGVAEVLDRPAQQSRGVDHPRSGDLVAIAQAGAWFTYYYWLDNTQAPDFARTVDIHRKPGYDPMELFLDPRLRLPRMRIAATLLKRQLGFRSLLNVIPLDASLVKGSHGRRPTDVEHSPLLLSSQRSLIGSDTVSPTAVRDLLLRHLE